MPASNELRDLRVLLTELQGLIVSQGKELAALRERRDGLLTTLKEVEEREMRYEGALTEIKTWLSSEKCQSQASLTAIGDIVRGVI